MPDNFFNQYKKPIESFIDQALIEDLGLGDHSSLSCIDAKDQSQAQLLIKQEGRIAGITLAKHIFKRYNSKLKITSYLEEGSVIKKGDVAFTVQGPTLAILATERLVLNTLQRMSGIASLTYEFSQMIKHTSSKLLDTRKTTPNFRYAEKWAVLIGGGINHRMGLFDAIMIKDNHVDFCGGMSKALEKTMSYANRLKKPTQIIVECRNKKEIEIALSFSKVSRILLDNYQPQELAEAIAIIDQRKSTEASGSISKKNLVEYAETGVDFISMGALTYGAKIIDLSLKAF
ncbi:MAG: carboxylating nicotinate-nucleotide diphosphorylase [Flavobacteriaceae bacterium]